MVTSKVTSKGQTTIPVAVRMALRLRPGDRVAYEIKKRRVVVTRIEPRPLADDSAGPPDGSRPPPG